MMKSIGILGWEEYLFYDGHCVIVYNFNDCLAIVCFELWLLSEIILEL